MDISHASPLHDHASASSGNNDRLSELPDSLILMILSLLPMNDVVKTTILSHRWNNLWFTVSCIHFSLDTRSDFISRVLAQWKGVKIHKFSVRSLYHAPQHTDIDSWLFFAIEKQVEDLLLDSRCNVYCPPQRLYSCSSITKLSIRCDELKIHKNVQWNQLKSLKIKGLHQSFVEDAIDKVLSGAPQLEEFSLNLYDIEGSLNIRSTSLKMLHIGKYKRGLCRSSLSGVLRIRAPNLVTLEISAVLKWNYKLDLDVPSLTNAVLRFLTSGREQLWHFRVFGRVLPLSRFEMFNQVFRSICHVEKLTLSARCVEFLVYFNKTNMNMIVPFSNAKCLKLYGSEADQILHVLEMFPNLMMLRAKLDVEEFDYTITEEEIHAFMVDECNSLVRMNLPIPSLPRMKTIEITWSVRYPLIIPAVRILLGSAHVLDKMVLRLGTHLTHPETFPLAKEKVLSMSRSSPAAQLIITKF